MSPDQVFQLVQFIVTEDLLYSLTENIHRLPFEARKDTQSIISNVLRFKQPADSTGDPVALQYVISTRPEIIIALCNGYDRRESAMPCGGILKEALKHDAVTALILYDEPEGPPLDLGSIDTDQPSTGNGVFWRFFEWIDKSLFEVSTDAFDTFRVCLSVPRATTRRNLILDPSKFSSGTSPWCPSTLIPISICSLTSTTMS